MKLLTLTAGVPTAVEATLDGGTAVTSLDVNGDIIYYSDSGSSNLHTAEVTTPTTLTKLQTVSMSEATAAALGYFNGFVYTSHDLGVLVSTYKVNSDNTLQFLSADNVSVRIGAFTFTDDFVFTNAPGGWGAFVYTTKGISCDITSPGPEKRDLTGLGNHGYLKDYLKDFEQPFTFPLHANEAFVAETASRNLWNGYATLGKNQETRIASILAITDSDVRLRFGDDSDDALYTSSAFDLNASDGWQLVPLSRIQTSPSKILSMKATTQVDGSFTGSIKISVSVERLT